MNGINKLIFLILIGSVILYLIINPLNTGVFPTFLNKDLINYALIIALVIIASHIIFDGY